MNDGQFDLFEKQTEYEPDPPPLNLPLPEDWPGSIGGPDCLVARRAPSVICVRVCPDCPRVVPEAGS